MSTSEAIRDSFPFASSQADVSNFRRNEKAKDHVISSTTSSNDPEITSQVQQAKDTGDRKAIFIAKVSIKKSNIR